MARVTINDCLTKVSNHFELVLLAAIRAKQIINGKNPTIKRNGSTNTVIALREIAEGTINIKNLKEQLYVMISSNSVISNLLTEKGTVEEEVISISTNCNIEPLVIEDTNGDIFSSE